jgi:LmbE family N-acetylglucosaminyl deacetylase
MNAILLSPHNDDESLFAAYLCQMYQPHVIVCLRSERMGSPHYPGGMSISAETRELETACATEALGVTWEQWEILDDYPAGWERELERKLLKLDSERIFAPAPELGGHEQHNVIGEMATEIFGAERVSHYLTYTANGRSTAGEQVPALLEWQDRKRQAMKCYASQAAHPATKVWFEQTDLREYVA